MMNVFKNNKRNCRGQAALLTVIFSVVISIAIIGGFVDIALRESRIAKLGFDAKRSLFSAEAGVEDVVYRLKKGKSISSQEELSLNGGTTVTTIIDIAGDKEVTAEGNIGGAVRREKINLRQGIVNVSLHYGIQVGSGGLVMQNNSRVEGVGNTPGNVYSNGPVTAGNGATVTGDLTVAGSGGSISNVNILGTARAHSITSSKICGDAYYSSIDASSLSFVNSPSGPVCSSPLTPGTAYPSSSDPLSAPFAISDSEIQGWKDDAEAGGVITGDCGDSGNAECIIGDNNTLPLGPKKINGNLVLTKKQTLVIMGTLYFTGHIDINSSSGATVKCDPAYGAKSCVIVTDGWIHIRNNAVFQGSGVSGSFLILLTTLTGCNGGSQTPSCTENNSAVDIANNATGAIFSAPNSMIHLSNGVHATELTANKISLDSNATVTYDQGLANAKFSSGPQGGWRIKSWGEVE